MRSLQALVRNYIEPLKTAFDTRVTTDGGTNEANDTQIDTWVNPWKSKILTLPNAFKAGKLYSIYGDDWDVVRAGATATRVKSDGEIQTGIAANVSRLDYLNGEPVVLVEGASTNLFLRSEEFDNAYWTKTRATIDPDVTTSPDGAMTADKFIATVESGGKVVARLITPSADETYYFSVFAKKSDYNFIGMLSSQPTQGKFFDLNNGTVLGNLLSAPLDAFIEDYGNGWFRCTIVLSENGSNKNLQVYLSSTGSNTSFTPASADLGVFLWGAKVATEFSSYIPTTTATVTRNADVIDVNVPAGTGEIVTTFEDGSTSIESTPGATYQLPNGRIKSVIFNP